MDLTERLKDFTPKTSVSKDDILYAGNSESEYKEVKVTAQATVEAYGANELYYPSNYTPTADTGFEAKTIPGNLKGIDDKFGTIESGSFEWTEDVGNTSGVSAVNFLFGSYVKVGDYIHANLKIDFTASSTTPIIAFTAPFVAPSQFTSISQSAVSVSISPQGTTATYCEPLDCGNLNASDSLYIGMKVATATGPDNVYTANISLSYQFQNFS
jgi:hypothetical protein